MRMSNPRRGIVVVGLIALLAAACGDDQPVVTDVAATTAQAPSTSEAATSTSATPETSEAPVTTVVAGEGCADVIDATIDGSSDGFTVSATVRSADTGWDKYADLWQVQTLDGEVLGERVLAHPHETEQPFTRSVSGVAIPAEISTVVVVARDSVAGFCGAGFTIEVPQS
jgi:hypothetical protein